MISSLVYQVLYLKRWRTESLKKCTNACSISRRYVNMIDSANPSTDRLLCLFVQWVKRVETPSEILLGRSLVVLHQCCIHLCPRYKSSPIVIILGFYLALCMARRDGPIMTTLIATNSANFMVKIHYHPRSQLFSPP